MLAALAGSTKMPSWEASHCWASRISASVTMSMLPPLSVMAAQASFQLAGVADADGGGDGLGFFDDFIVEDGGAAGGLEAGHAGGFFVALPSWWNSW